MSIAFWADDETAYEQRCFRSVVGARGPGKALLGVVAATVFLLAFGLQAGWAATGGGISIANTASATYGDVARNVYTTFSNAVTTTVQNVGSFDIAPKQTACSSADAFGAGQSLVRTFIVKNNGNAPDSYVLTNFTASAGKVTGITFIGADGAVSTGAVGTTSPSIPPGGAFSIRVSLATTGVSPGTNLLLQASIRNTASTVNGTIIDAGTECVLALIGPSFSGSGGLTTPIRMLVDGVVSLQSLPGATVAYSVVFQNSGGAAATNAVFTDALAATFTVLPASVKLDGADVSAQAVVRNGILTLPLGTVLPNVSHTISFAATVAAGSTVGTSALNSGAFQADGVTQTATTPASIFFGVADVVYDGYAGGAVPLAGATVTLVDPSNRAAPLNLSGPPLAPNTTGANPFVTGADGRYSFAFGSTQLVAKTYELTLQAPGYLNRRITLQIVPDATHSIYDVSAVAEDGQPLAKSGTFSLVAGTVNSPIAHRGASGKRLRILTAGATSVPAQVVIQNVYGLFGNLPMFRTQPLQLKKTADRSFASSGDRLIYTLSASASPTGATPFGATVISDQLPPQLAYAPGTARVDGVPIEPKRVGRVLSWSFPDFSTPHTIFFATVVQQSLDPNTVVTNTASVTAASPHDPTIFASAAASVEVQITAGVFSIQTIITGRVFVDIKGTGRFAPGDRGLGNVRIYRENGESVQTDAAGRFNFPGVAPGMHVLRLDETSLPSDTRPYPVHAYDDERSTRRLVHGIFDGGLLQDVNFAVRAAP